MAIEQTYKLPVGITAGMSEADAWDEAHRAAYIMGVATQTVWRPEVVENPLAGSGYTWRVVDKVQTVITPAPFVNGKPNGFNARNLAGSDLVAHGRTLVGAMNNLFSRWRARQELADRVCKRMMVTVGLAEDL